MSCQIPEGCILHEQSGYCPLCDLDGADKIAEWLADHQFTIILPATIAPDCVTTLTVGACACIGPQNGEKLCPCALRRAKEPK